MSSIATIWINRIRAANPILAAIAQDIARQSVEQPGYDAEAAIAAKLDEWKESPDSQMGRALGFAVIFYQEDFLARREAQLDI